MYDNNYYDHTIRLVFRFDSRRQHIHNVMYAITIMYSYSHKINTHACL
jgi:hypothetical protein